MSACSNGAPIVRLPGQTEPASKVMIQAINDVQNQIDRPLRFYNIQNYPDQIVRTYNGVTAWKNQEVQIWLNPSLEHYHQEAVAAHELAHILQAIEGYYAIVIEEDEQGQSLFPPLNRLAGVYYSTRIGRKSEVLLS